MIKTKIRKIIKSVILLPIFLTIIYGCYQPQPDDDDRVKVDSISSELTKIKEDVDKVAEKITVRITNSDNEDDYGSGVIVAKNEDTYYILTAAHVVQKNNKYRITTHDEQEYSPKSIDIIEGVDLAVVEFNSRENYPIASLANYSLAIGDTQLLLVSGFRQKNENGDIEKDLTVGFTLNTDITSFDAKNADSFAQGYELVYTNESRPGMSGGPIFDQSKRVIGINTGAEADLGEDLQGDYADVYLGYSLGVPISTFLNLISTTNIKRYWIYEETSTPLLLTESKMTSIQDELFNLPQKPSRKKNSIAWLNYGNQLWRASDSVEEYEETLAVFETAIEINRDLHQAYYAKGLTLISLEKYEEALIAFEEALELKSGYSEYWRKKAEVLSSLQRNNEALKSINKAIELKEDDFISYTQKASILLSFNPPEYFSNEEKAEWDLSQDIKAEKAFSQAIKLAPNNFFLYLLRGMIRVASKNEDQHSKGISDLTKSIQLKPDNNFVYAIYGEAYTQLAINTDGNEQLQYLNQALIMIDKAIKYTNNKEVLSYFYAARGQIYALLEDFPQAEKDFNTALQYNPHNGEVYFYRGRIALLKGEGEFQSAVTNFDEAIKILNDNSDQDDNFLSLVYSVRGIVQTQLDYLNLASADCNRAIEIDQADALNDFGEGYSCLGFVYQKQNKYDQALDSYRESLDKDLSRSPNFKQFVTAYIGLIEYEQGKTEESYEKLAQASDILPEAKLAMAVISYQDGDEDKAIILSAEALNQNKKLADLNYLKKYGLWGDRLLEDTEELFNNIEENYD